MSQGTYNGDRTTALLNIVETNPFKHLTHLSLKFVPGSDADVKKHLADCLKQLKVSIMPYLKKRIDVEYTCTMQKK